MGTLAVAFTVMVFPDVELAAEALYEVTVEPM
jgi:hypothetical protein